MKNTEASLKLRLKLSLKYFPIKCNYNLYPTTFFASRCSFSLFYPSGASQMESFCLICLICSSFSLVRSHPDPDPPEQCLDKRIPSTPALGRHGSSAPCPHPPSPPAGSWRGTQPGQSAAARGRYMFSSQWNPR